MGNFLDIITGAWIIKLFTGGYDGAGYNKEYNTMMTEAHNTKRALHQNTDPLTFSASLAKAAQSWAESNAMGGAMEHASNLGDLGQGENLAWHSNPSGEDDEWAVVAWYDEINDYDFNNPGFSA